MPSPHSTRRRFLTTSSAAASTLILPSGTLFGRKVKPNEKLNLGVIGAGGKGAADSDGCSSENVVAICDVDSNTLAARGKRWPKAKQYRDYRKMLEEMGDKIDAVTVSTPDHHHFPASMLAIQQGIHVYVQKPLAHSVWEARTMLEAARKHKVITQMGNQGHSYNSTRKLVEYVRGGVLGEVKDVHVWTNRPIWPQGGGRPAAKKAPSNLDWDLWLGPAAERPFGDGYHPFKWRGFWDFGTGALGDMGCHNMDAAFWALDLGSPTSVEAESAGMTNEMAPKSSTIRYEFPARGDKPPVTLTWYDGGRKPDPKLIGEKSLPANGSLIIGSKGSIAFKDWNPNGFRLLPEESFKNFQEPAPFLPRVNDNPYQEWIKACKGGDLCLSNFEYSVPLTEMVLLGNVAMRAEEKLQWDGENLKVTNTRSADEYLKREPRKGWKVV